MVVARGWIGGSRSEVEVGDSGTLSGEDGNASGADSAVAASDDYDLDWSVSMNGISAHGKQGLYVLLICSFLRNARLSVTGAAADGMGLRNMIAYLAFK